MMEGVEKERGMREGESNGYVGGWMHGQWREGEKGGEAEMEGERGMCGWMDRWVEIRRAGWMDGCMGAWKEGRIDAYYRQVPCQAIRNQ